MTRPTRSIMTRVAVLAVAVPALVAACSSGGGGAATAAPEASTAAPTAVASPIAGIPAECPTSQPEPLSEKRTVTIATDQGPIEIEIDGALSPIAAGNFVTLAECGFYDNVVFHRIVPGFVIQGGDGQYGRSPDLDPSLVGTGGPPYTIEDEPVTTPYSRGTVAMARTPQPDSVGSQFFIVLDDAARPPLEDANTYQIIGSVTSGMEAVDAIAAVQTGPGDQPIDPVVMNDVSVATP